jgi:hypothetical protein
MTPASMIQRMRVEVLRKQRNPLWERFECNPSETHLAVELKIIDDLIAECIQKMGMDDEEATCAQQIASEVGCR